MVAFCPSLCKFYGPTIFELANDDCPTAPPLPCNNIGPRPTAGWRHSSCNTAKKKATSGDGCAGHLSSSKAEASSKKEGKINLQERRLYVY